MSVERVPLAQSINKRSANDNKDNTIINCLFESHPTGKRLVKRPGLLPQITVSSGGLSQGIFPWNSRLVTILNNEVWGMTLSSGTQFGTLPGTVPKRNLSFTQTASDAHLVINDQSNFYYITKASVDAGTPTVVAPSGTVTDVTMVTEGGYYGLPVSCTITSGVTTTVTKTAHGLIDGQGVEFSATTMPTGLTTNTTYQVRYVDANTFTINTATAGGGIGSAVITSTAGTTVVYIPSPTVTFSATSPDIAATGTAKLYNHRVASVIVTSSGTYASTVPTITISSAFLGTTATAGYCSLYYPGSNLAYITSIAFGTSGSGYLTAPTVSFTPGANTWINSMPAAYTTINSTGQVTSIVVTSGGSLGSSITLGHSVFATLSAPTATDATATAVMGSGGITGPFAYGIEYLDGYLFIMKTDGSIYQTQNLNDPTVWIASVIRAESEPDAGQALFKHLNYLLAFGEWSTDVFYNAGNPTGSTLNVNKANKLEIGCVSGPSVAKLEQSIIWVGQSKTQGRGVYMMDGLSPFKVSTRTVDKYLNSLVPWGECFSYCVKFGGHTLYVLTLTDHDTTLVYDIDEKEWTFFSSQTLGTEHYFNQTHYAGDVEYFGQPFMLHATDGTISVFDSEYYLDNTDAIYCTVRTPITDSGTTKRKFYRKVEVVGDKVSGTAYIGHSDTDYQTTSALRSVDLIRERPIIFQSGQARRRSWTYFYADPTPMRVEALEVDYDIGEIQA